jgi:sulfur carrier protein
MSELSVVVNGKKTILTQGLNLQQVLDKQGYKNEQVAIALNETFIARSQYQNTLIEANDCIDIVAPMQGG